MAAALSVSVLLVLNNSVFLPSSPIRSYSPKSLRLECRLIPPPLGGTTGIEGSVDPSLLLRLAATLLARLRDPTEGCRLGVMLRGGVCRAGETGDTVMISSVMDELLSVRTRGGSSGSGVANREELAKDGFPREGERLELGKLSIPSPCCFTEDRRRSDSRLFGAMAGTEGEEASPETKGSSWCADFCWLAGDTCFTLRTSGWNETSEAVDSV